MTLFEWLQKAHEKLRRRPTSSRRCIPAQRVSAVRPCLEHLEDRLTPSLIATATDASISITPNPRTLTAAETITATVTQFGMTTPVTTGNVFFSVNNQTGTAALNSNGQATLTFTLPLFAVGANQDVSVVHESDAIYGTSVLNWPVYLNLFNEMLSAQITHNGQQTIVTPPTASSVVNAAVNETDTLFVFLRSAELHYVDPGAIAFITLDP